MAKLIQIVVINGSPKGEKSLSLQHSLYMLGQEQDISWKIAHVGEALSEKDYDRQWLAKTMADIESSDAVIWTTPVYTMLVPWQLVRFCNLVRAAGKEGIFFRKYATSMMTCFHYYDHLAEEWLQGMSEDWGMYYMEGRTADNTDMLKPEHRASMRFFMHEFVRSCRNQTPLPRKTRPLSRILSPHFTYQKPGPSNFLKKTPRNQAMPRSVLLTDEYKKERNLSRMIDAFVEKYPYPVEIVDISDFPYEGGCKGCLRCQLVGECARQDGFQQFYLDLVDTCDVLIFGMNLEGRYLKSVWKLFLDRTFSNGHRTSMMGKHTCYLVAGPLREMPTVRQFLEGKDMVGRENSMGIVSDEYTDSHQLYRLLKELAERLARAYEAHYQKSINFLGIGGMKIFRDLIYSMRGVVKDDHHFYKKRGLYDFPQRDIPKRFNNLLMGTAFLFKPVRLQTYERMPDLYIQKHKQIVDSGKP